MLISRGFFGKSSENGWSAEKAPIRRGIFSRNPESDEDSEGINIRVDDYKGFTNVYYGHMDENPTISSAGLLL